MRSSVGLVLCTATVIAGFSAGCGPREPRFPTVDRLPAGIFLEPTARAALPDGMELRSVSNKGISLTKVSEGFRSNLYNDAAGYCTIAYGHLIKLARCDGTEPAEFLDGVTDDEGTELLVDDMSTAQVAVMLEVNDSVTLTDGQYAALCDFVFNVGTGNFRRSTLLKVINADGFEDVPHQLRRWVRAGGRVLPGLVTRREKEIELFFDGIPVPRAAPRADLTLEQIDIRTGEEVQG